MYICMRGTTVFAMKRTFGNMDGSESLDTVSENCHWKQAFQF